MNKAELVEAIAKKTGGTKASVEGTLDALMDTVTLALGKGESVALIGFGTFSVSKPISRARVSMATVFPRRHPTMQRLVWIHFHIPLRAAWTGLAQSVAVWAMHLVPPWSTERAVSLMAASKIAHLSTYLDY